MKNKEKTNIPEKGIIKDGKIFTLEKITEYCCEKCAFIDDKIYDVCTYDHMPCLVFDNMVIFKEWKGGEK